MYTRSSETIYLSLRAQVAVGTFFRKSPVCSVFNIKTILFYLITGEEKGRGQIKNLIYVCPSQKKKGSLCDQNLFFEIKCRNFICSQN